MDIPKLYFGLNASVSQKFDILYRLTSMGAITREVFEELVEDIHATMLDEQEAIIAELEN